MSIGQKFYLSLVILLSLVSFLVYQHQQKAKTPVWLKNIAVSSFTINNTNLFKTKDDQWFFKSQDRNQQPADVELVNFFVKGLQTITLDVLVSNNPRNFENFGINNASPLVTVNGQKFLIGNLGPKYDSTYVEVLDNTSVYEVPQIWGNKEVAKVEYWKLKFVNNVSIYQIKKIQIGNKNIEPIDGKWPLGDSVSKLAYLKAGKFIGDAKPDNLASYLFKISMDNGDNIEIEVGGRKNNYWAKKDNYYFQIDDSDFDLLTLLLK